MKKEHNIDLSKYTTFKMGGIATSFYTPETEVELIELLKNKEQKYLIGGGSNLLINQRIFDSVVNLREFNTEIIDLGDGTYEVGASVRLQKLITVVNQNGYGGIEYLYSVPGLVGGAVLMNAGRGRSYQMSISDYILSVKVLFNGEIKWINKENCQFSYRSSIFKQMGYVVLAAKFKFIPMEKEATYKKRKDRIELCRKTQDNSLPNFGTVFCESDKLIMKAFQMMLFRKSGKVMFSSKTINWMLNDGGTFEDVERLLERVEKTHKFLGKNCQKEVIVWK